MIASHEVIAARAPRRLTLVALLALLAQLGAQPQFREIRKQPWPLPDQTRDLPLIADFDRDGDLDTLWSGTQTQLLINDGSALFTDETLQRLPGTQTAYTVMGDVDGDGDVDLVRLTEASIWFNDGRGRFTSVRGLLPTQPTILYSASLADCDGDQDLDLVLTGYTVNMQSQSLWLNDGRGRFTDGSAGRLPQPSNTGTAVLTSDLDRDGDTDLLIGATLWINTGSGVFRDESGGRLPTLVVGSALGVADFDRDGDRDILFQQPYPLAQVRLLLDDGTGVWRDATAGRIPYGLWNMTIGDFDGDGDADLLGNGERLLSNDGQAVFFESGTRAVPARAGAYAAEAFDADGDGDLDLATISSYLPAGLLLNDGRGTFRDASEPWCPASWSGYARGLTLLDIDRDGDQDVMALADGPSLFCNDGDGRLRHEPWRMPRLPWLQTGVMAVGDIDGDGDSDAIIAGDSNWPPFFVLLNDGAGRFTDATGGRLAYGSRSAASAVLRDMDGDGDLDLFVVNRLAPAALLHNDGRGSFSDVSASRLPPENRAAAGAVVAPLVGDPLPDIALVVAGATPRLWRNSPAGFVDVTATAMPSTPSDAQGITAGDSDGDGDVDLLLVAYRERSRLYENDGAGRFVAAPAGRLPGTAVLVQAELIDADGDRDLDVLSTSALWLNDGRGTFMDASAARLQVRGEQVNSQAIGDLDGDGDVDLLAQGAYLPLRLYFNHVRQLDTPLLARAGRRFDLALEADPGFATTDRAALVLLGARRLSPPLALPPWGHLALDPSAPLLQLANVWLPAATGRGATSFTLPFRPELSGSPLHFQALFLEASAVAAWRLSNPRTDLLAPR